MSNFRSFIMAWINKIFFRAPPIDSGVQDARDAVTRFSRGNVAVQSGLFLTPDDLEKERGEISRLRLSD